MDDIRFAADRGTADFNSTSLALDDVGYPIEAAGG